MVAHGMPAAAHRPHPVHPRDELSICAQVSLRYEAEHLLLRVAWHRSSLRLPLHRRQRQLRSTGWHARITAASSSPPRRSLSAGTRCARTTSPGWATSSRTASSRRGSTRRDGDVDTTRCPPSACRQRPARRRRRHCRASGAAARVAQPDERRARAEDQLRLRRLHRAAAAFVRSVHASDVRLLSAGRGRQGDLAGRQPGRQRRRAARHLPHADREEAEFSPTPTARSCSWSQNSNKSGLDCGSRGGSGVDDDYNLGGFAALTAAATALRLNHYIARPAAECRRKKQDQARAGATRGVVVEGRRAGLFIASARRRCDAARRAARRCRFVAGAARAGDQGRDGTPSAPPRCRRRRRCRDQEGCTHAPALEAIGDGGQKPSHGSGVRARRLTSLFDEREREVVGRHVHLAL